MTNVILNEKTKPFVQRSPRFPAYSLESMIEVIESARKFGRTVTNAQIAGDGSINSGSFLRRKAALGYFGLIEGRGENIRLSDLTESILYPKENEREAAVKNSFLNPDIFKRLYLTTTKNVPVPLSMLGNILVRDYHIQPAAKNEFISVFIRSGVYAKLVKYNDDTKSDIIFLDEDSKIDTFDKEEQKMIAPATILTPSYRYDEISQPENQTVELSLTNGNAKLIVPKELTSADAKRLRAQINILANILEDV